MAAARPSLLTSPDTLGCQNYCMGLGEIAAARPSLLTSLAIAKEASLRDAFSVFCCACERRKVFRRLAKNRKAALRAALLLLDVDPERFELSSK